MKKIDIVLPIYFNAQSLENLFSELIKIRISLSLKSIATTYIFVDDGSKDESLAKILDFKKNEPNIKVIKLTRNFGATLCSKTGLSFCDGDAAIILAADLQDPPDLINQMVELWLEGSKFVICERVARNDPFISKLFSKIFYIMVNKLVISNYPKGGFDLALMDKSLLPYIINSAKSSFTPLLAFWLGYEPKIIKYHREKRKSGKSKWTFSKKINACLDIFLSFSNTPLRLISGFGLVTALLSFSYGSSVIIGAIFKKIPVEGFATLVSLITFLLGLIIIMLGFLGEYIWRIFEELNRRPNVVIEEIWD